MAARLPRLIAAILGLFATVFSGSEAQVSPRAAALGREVVTRDMIEDAALLRLGEVVRLAPEWSAATVDDFTWRAAPRGLGPGAEDAWTLLVDGRPVEIGALGVASLERLPLDLAAIDSIVFVSSPTLEGGIFASAGLVHIYTRRPGKGLSARGRLAFGSETGDPGPFVFLPGGRANRDRYGHESAVEGAIRHRGWHAAGSYTAGVHLPTDPLILQRIYASSALTPRIERVVPSVRIGVDGDAGSHQLIAGTSRMDDWMRLELAGIEVPVRSTLAHLSAAGAVQLSWLDLGYRAGYEQSRIASRPGATAPPLDFEWRTLRGSVEVSPSGTTGRRVGVSWVRRSGLRHQAQSLGRDLELGAFGELTVGRTAGLHHHLAASLSGRGHGAEGGVVLTSVLAAAAGEFLLRLTASRKRAMTEMGLIELAARGEPWLDAADIPANLPPVGEAVRVAGAELGWTRGAGARTSVSASAFVRAFDGTLATQRELAWDPVFLAWRGPVLVNTTAGRLAGGHIGARYRVSRTLEASAHGHLTRAFGETAFRRAAEPVPSIRSTIAATWRPVEGFGLRTEVEIESERRWPDYDVSSSAPGKARAEQPGGVTASVTGWKMFLDGRLRGQFAARNLTGRRIILHPEGRASALAFFFLLGAAF